MQASRDEKAGDSIGLVALVVVSRTNRTTAMMARSVGGRKWMGPWIESWGGRGSKVKIDDVGAYERVADCIVRVRVWEVLELLDRKRLK